MEALGPLAEPILLNQADSPPRTLVANPRSHVATSREIDEQNKDQDGDIDNRTVSPRAIRQPAELLLNPQESLVLQAIGVEPTLVDQIVSETNLPINRVLATISVLQARRLIRRISGTQVARV
jgi:predicted Rossmann fold nucleotide-binding protein DprA/Smf involved in DNA uptake